MELILIHSLHLPPQRGTQWWAWGCRVGWTQTPGANQAACLSFSPDSGSSVARSVCAASVHTRMLPHSPGSPGALRVDVTGRSAGPQPVGEIPPSPWAHRPYSPVWLVFHSTGEPLRADRCVRRWRVGGGGASTGSTAVCDPLPAVATGAGGLEGGGAKGTETSGLILCCKYQTLFYVWYVIFVMFQVVPPVAKLARLSCVFLCSSDLFLERPVQKLTWGLFRLLTRS